MQVTIEVEPQTFALLQEARAKGIALDDLLREALRKANAENHLQTSRSADEWIASLKNWANKNRSLPEIPDEALRRENLYEDRI